MKLRILTMIGLLTLSVSAHAQTKPSKPKKPHVPADLICLAKNIYHEARGEVIRGQLAVARVTLARLNSHKWGKSICAVVYAPKQFSWTANEPAVKDKLAWETAITVAKYALKHPMNDGPTHYVARRLEGKLRWMKRMTVVSYIGGHVFYSVKG